MRQELMSLFNDENYIRMNANEICTHLGKTSSKDFVEIVKTLNALEDEGIIYRTKKNKYDLIERFNFKVGPIDIKRKALALFELEKMTAMSLFQEQALMERFLMISL